MPGKQVEDWPTRAGRDRDEYPPAVGRWRGKGLVRGSNPRGWMADVAYVPSAENRSHGSVLGTKLRRFRDDTRFRYVFYQPSRSPSPPGCSGVLAVPTKCGAEDDPSVVRMVLGAPLALTAGAPVMVEVRDSGQILRVGALAPRRAGAGSARAGVGPRVRESVEFSRGSASMRCSVDAGHGGPCFVQRSAPPCIGVAG